MSLETRGEHELLGSLVTCTYSDPFVEASGLFEFDDRRVCSNVTVGWLIEYGVDVVRIAAERADDDAWRWVTTIPTVIVTELVPLARQQTDRGGEDRDAAAASADRASERQAPSRGEARSA